MKTQRPFTFGKVGGLILAASIVAPSTALFAEHHKSTDHDKSENRQQLQSNREDVREFKGTIVSAYDYLMQEQANASRSGAQSRDANTADATGTRYHNPSRSDLTAANSAEAATQQERNRTANSAVRTGEDNTRSSDRSWMREPAGSSVSSGMNSGPMGLLVQTDGVLELGTGAKFYLLIPQDGQTVNQNSYSQLDRSASPFANRDQNDRSYVSEQLEDEPGSKKGGEKQTELSSQREFGQTASESKSDHQVTVMGKVVQRGGLEAIIVHNMSWKGEQSELDRTPARTGDRDRNIGDRDRNIGDRERNTGERNIGDRNRNTGNTTDRERNDSNNRVE